MDLRVERSDVLHFIKCEVFECLARGGSGNSFFYCFALFFANGIKCTAAIEPDARVNRQGAHWHAMPHAHLMPSFSSISSYCGSSDASPDLWPLASLSKWLYLVAFFKRASLLRVRGEKQYRKPVVT
jgi:hypothetical protein